MVKLVLSHTEVFSSAAYLNICDALEEATADLRLVGNQRPDVLHISLPQTHGFVGSAVR